MRKLTDTGIILICGEDGCLITGFMGTMAQVGTFYNYLGVIIGLAPMLGLLGTITGMISSFNALNERAQNPMAVTAGIGEALITTVFGLCIAILGMCIHAWLSNQIKTETLNIYEVSSTLSDIIQARNDNRKCC